MNKPGSAGYDPDASLVLFIRKNSKLSSSPPRSAPSPSISRRMACSESAISLGGASSKPHCRLMLSFCGRNPDHALAMVRIYVLARQVTIGCLPPFDRNGYSPESFCGERSRTHDQMVKAARSSGKNIAEGSRACPPPDHQGSETGARSTQLRTGKPVELP